MTRTPVDATSERQAVARVLTQLTSHASLVFAAVGDVAEYVFATIGHERPLELAALDGLEDLVRPLLEDRRSHIWGAGFVADPGAFPDRGGLQWWCRSGPGRSVRRLVVSLNPSSVDFYDYTIAPWFVGARDRGANVTGPYVDATGTNEYILTFSQAVHSGDRFLGVAGADVLVGTLQSVMQPAMRAIRGEACLIDAEGLVIVTNAARLLAGTVQPDPDRGDIVAGVAWAPWRLAIRLAPGSRRRRRGAVGD